MAKKQLYRSRDNRVVSGVAGGLAEYFDIDPIIIRILFILLAIGHGSGVVLYIIGMLAIPEEPITGTSTAHKTSFKTKADAPADAPDEEEKSTPKDKNSNRTFGIILLAVGVIGLMNMFAPFFDVFVFWPLVLIIAGFVIMSRGGKDRS